MRAPDAAEDRDAFAAWRNDSDNAAAYARVEADWHASAQASRARLDVRGQASRLASGSARRPVAAVIAVGARNIGSIDGCARHLRQPSVIERWQMTGQTILVNGC